MITIEGGKIYVDSVETDNTELIGNALKDYAEASKDDKMCIYLKDNDVFIYDKTEKQHEISEQLL
ncbi:hypothetical protein JJC03_09220 [Flavobacterium oreochromis]|uniref:hypothetical protein n=1 Tax=Flavobacterium oreochromis TaxID=2906078 RepID=UPI001CE5571F|nr:hypothetical protein [Flavobacterium oreochromis]QYS85418.1 hypothetical protein JJC03_09220 [Flavobacterium oreochromis]